MVVMVTPVAFASIGYKTYIIFAVINAFMVPCVYFFFPETAYRSLEEMDEIFHKSTNPFDVVKVAFEVPHRYDKRGDLLISYEETEEAQMFAERRRSSVAAQPATSAGLNRSDDGEKRRAEYREERQVG
jgi:hypothetical protein